MVGLTPDEYTSATGITKIEYEERVLAGAREAALRFYPLGSQEAAIETVGIEGDGLDTRLVILFRIQARPECLFGRRENLWPFQEWVDPTTPEEDGALSVSFGVGEYIEQRGLVVRDCSPDGITWLP